MKGAELKTQSGQCQDQSVYSRYAAAAQTVVADLCCPVEYRAEYLNVIPKEVLERDYGCGDPTPYVRPGDTVLDLGSGGGKICFIAAQVVGPFGRVIGVDCNAEMLALARRHQLTVAERLGFANVEFRCGLIQDLQLDLELLGDELAKEPISDYIQWQRLRRHEDRLRREATLIPDASIDCVVSNCVLNLIHPPDRRQLLTEVYRVLKPDGRLAISDIVADQIIPETLQRDPELWSGCVSGALREDHFLQIFKDAGFHNIQVVRRQSEPWRVIDDIEFRSMTVMASKGGHFDMPLLDSPQCEPNGCC